MIDLLLTISQEAEDYALQIAADFGYHSDDISVDKMSKGYLASIECRGSIVISGEPSHCSFEALKSLRKALEDESTRS